MSYGIRKEVDMSFSDAVTKVREALQKEGFGILTEIDVKTTLKKKLDVDYEDYTILGACNPPFAYKALQAEKEIGLLLPCNVIVYVQHEKTYVSAINPVEAMSIIQNSTLREIASQVQEKLRHAIETIK